jgi:hypothetical protein
MQKHPTSAAWRQTVERLLKAEMSKRAVKYQDLSERLAAVGITQTADNLRNKINKGILGADLLIQILERQTLLEILAEMGHRWED